MGKIEYKNRKRTKRKHLQKMILRSIAVAGVLSIGLLAPNVLGAFGKLGIIPSNRQREYIASSASKLKKRRLISFNGKGYQLTTEGKRLLDIWICNDFKFEKQKKWDEKWRMIIFDIPENKRRARRQVCRIFQKSGFVRLQDSVWVYPYDCEDVITLLKTSLYIGKDLLYVIVDELENDKHLREHFGLI